jgi:hypothetical protein
MQIPYLVLKYHSEEPRDIRENPEGEPLRSSTNLSFMGLESKGCDPYLHEAMISILLTGIDNWTWVALCCPDAFFETKDLTKHFAGMNDKTTSPDPLTRGDYVVGANIKDPRVYFLKVILVWIRKILRDWNGNVKIVTKAIEKGYVVLI